MGNTKSSWKSTTWQDLLQHVSASLVDWTSTKLKSDISGFCAFTWLLIFLCSSLTFGYVVYTTFSSMYFHLWIKKIVVKKNLKRWCFRCIQIWVKMLFLEIPLRWYTAIFGHKMNDSNEIWGRNNWGGNGLLFIDTEYLMCQSHN